MKKIILIFIFCLVYTIGHSQTQDWKILSESSKNNLVNSNLKFTKKPTKEQQTFSLDFNKFQAKTTLAEAKKIIELPTENGIQKFSIKEASSISTELARKYPMIKSFIASGINNPNVTARISFGTDGLHAVIYAESKSPYYIDPVTKENNIYIGYSKKNLSVEDSKFVCEVNDVNSNQTIESSAQQNFGDGKLRTYRLAVITTGEYSQFHLNQQGVSAAATDAVKKAAILSAINTTITRVNGVFENDLSVRMEIVANNDSIIFLDENTDNLTNYNEGVLIDEIQPIIDNIIGNANYDIGHAFSTGDDAGAASLNSVCVTGNKAKGVTGRTSPIGDAYDIDFVAHEMGHQFGATHTFNNSCNGNRTNSTAVEPGSGSTIMAYAGICAPNVQADGDAYFHVVSIAQMWNNIISKATCATITNLENSPPTSNAGADYSIPRSTPFILRGVGTDVDASNTLTYNWEQTNNGIATMPPVSTNTLGPTFRTFAPTNSPNRYLPSLATVVGGSISSTWEVVPSVARELNFSLVVRDNNVGGGVATRDDMKVSVVEADPFIVTSQNTTTSWNVGATEAISWNVGATNITPINSTNVNIKLSVDGGVTFPIILKLNTPNDGTEVITVPNNPSTTVRIMVEAADNIFYNVNATNLTINSTEPTFILSNLSGSKSACSTVGEIVTYDLNLDFINGFSETTTLSLANAPVGANVSFSPPNINADGNVTMSVSNFNAASQQEYTMVVSATSSSITKTTDAILKLYGTNFSDLTLTSPSNTETAVSLTPILTWRADINADSYDLQIATDTAFSSIVLSTSSSTNSFTVPVALNSNTTYFWRVKPKNSCSNGVFSNVSQFTTGSCVICTSNGSTEYNTSTTLVKFNTINNVTAKPSGYTDYSNSFSTTVLKNETYQLTIQTNTDSDNVDSYTTNTRVWIDWNRNCSFNDAGEMYDLGNVTGSNNGVTSLSPLNITVPASAGLGETLMRVSTKYLDDGVVVACETNFDGEVEDYKIIIDETASTEDFSFNGFNLFPNPSQGEFNLKFETIYSDKVSVKLFDLRGRFIKEHVFKNVKTNFSEKVTFNKVTKGLYLVKITNGNKQATRKLIIE